MTRKGKQCSFCESLDHTAFYCPKRPRSTLGRSRKPMKKIGNVTNKWIETRKRWLHNNKAPYYFCHYCNQMMTRTQLTLDHMESRSRHPELRFVLSNLVPCCVPCNVSKGSRSHDEFPHECDIT